jgi:hypothetical protein
MNLLQDNLKNAVLYEIYRENWKFPKTFDRRLLCEFKWTIFQIWIKFSFGIDKSKNIVYSSQFL